MPEDFTPYRRFADNTTKRQTLSNFDRAKALGERETIGDAKTLEEKADLEARDKKLSEDLLNEKTRRFMEKLSDKSKSMLSKDSKFVMAGTKFDNITDSLNYFPNDAQKNARFKQYVLEQEGLAPAPVPGLSKPSILSENEEKEFSRLYMVFEEKRDRDKLFKSEQEKLLFKIDEMKEKIEKVKKLRVIEDWIPDKVVCIRFGVPQPKKKGAQISEEHDFEGKVMPALQKDLNKHKIMGISLEEPDSKLAKRLLSDLDQEIGVEDQENQDAAEKVLLEEGNKGPIMPDENNINIGKADQDLFDSIFN